MNKKILYSIVGVLVFMILLLGYFMYQSYQADRAGGGTTAFPAQTPPDEVSQNDSEPQKSDIGPQESVDNVSVGTGKISSGIFIKIESRQIYYKTSSGKTTLPIADLVVLSCTNQNLETMTELDFDKIVSMHTMKPGELDGKISANEFIVTFAEYIKDVLKVHTVAISASSCGSL